MKFNSLSFGVCLFAAGLSMIGAPAIQAQREYDARIDPTIRVVDGDTVHQGDKTFRLVGFDAPETSYRAKCASEQRLGEDAKQRLQEIIAGGGVQLEQVPCSCRPGTEGTRRCNYARSCARLTSRGEDVAAIMIREKLARPYVCGSTRCPKREGWCGR